MLATLKACSPIQLPCRLVITANRKMQRLDSIVSKQIVYHVEHLRTDASSSAGWPYIEFIYKGVSALNSRL